MKDEQLNIHTVMSDQELEFIMVSRLETLHQCLSSNEYNYRIGVIDVLLNGRGLEIDSSMTMKDYEQSIFKQYLELNNPTHKAYPKDNLDPNYLYISGKIDAMFKHLNGLRQHLMLLD